MYKYDVTLTKKPVLTYPTVILRMAIDQSILQGLLVHCYHLRVREKYLARSIRRMSAGRVMMALGVIILRRVVQTEI